MLVITRRIRQRIVIDGGRIVIELLRLGEGKAVIGIQAPPDVVIDREEVHERKMAAHEMGGEG